MELENLILLNFYFKTIAYRFTENNFNFVIPNGRSYIFRFLDSFGSFEQLPCNIRGLRDIVYRKYVILICLHFTHKRRRLGLKQLQ